MSLDGSVELPRAETLLHELRSDGCGPRGNLVMINTLRRRNQPIGSSEKLIRKISAMIAHSFRLFPFRGLDDEASGARLG